MISRSNITLSSARNSQITKTPSSRRQSQLNLSTIIEKIKSTDCSMPSANTNPTISQPACREMARHITNKGDDVAQLVKEYTELDVEKLRCRGVWDNPCLDSAPMVITALPELKGCRLVLENSDHRPYFAAVDGKPVELDNTGAENTVRIVYCENGVAPHYNPIINGKMETIPSDGDCFFRSVLSALKGQIASDDDTHKLRTRMAEHFNRLLSIETTEEDLAGVSSAKEFREIFNNTPLGPLFRTMQQKAYSHRYDVNLDCKPSVWDLLFSASHAVLGMFKLGEAPPAISSSSDAQNRKIVAYNNRDVAKLHNESLNSELEFSIEYCGEDIQKKNENITLNRSGVSISDKSAFVQQSTPEEQLSVSHERFQEAPPVNSEKTPFLTQAGPLAIAAASVISTNLNPRAALATTTILGVSGYIAYKHFFPDKPNKEIPTPGEGSPRASRDSPSSWASYIPKDRLLIEGLKRLHKIDKIRNASILDTSAIILLIEGEIKNAIKWFEKEIGSNTTLTPDSNVFVTENNLADQVAGGLIAAPSGSKGYTLRDILTRKKVDDDAEILYMSSSDSSLNLLPLMDKFRKGNHQRKLENTLDLFKKDKRAIEALEQYYVNSILARAGQYLFEEGITIETKDAIVDFLEGKRPGELLVFNEEVITSLFFIPIGKEEKHSISNWQHGLLFNAARGTVLNVTAMRATKFLGKDTFDERFYKSGKISPNVSKALFDNLSIKNQEFFSHALKPNILDLINPEITTQSQIGIRALAKAMCKANLVQSELSIDALFRTDSEVIAGTLLSAGKLIATALASTLGMTGGAMPTVGARFAILTAALGLDATDVGFSLWQAHLSDLSEKKSEYIQDAILSGALSFLLYARFDIPEIIGKGVKKTELISSSRQPLSPKNTKLFEALSNHQEIKSASDSLTKLFTITKRYLENETPSMKGLTSMTTREDAQVFLCKSIVAIEKERGNHDVRSLLDLLDYKVSLAVMDLSKKQKQSDIRLSTEWSYKLPERSAKLANQKNLKLAAARWVFDKNLFRNPSPSAIMYKLREYIGAGGFLGTGREEIVKSLMKEVKSILTNVRRTRHFTRNMQDSLSLRLSPYLTPAQIKKTKSLFKRFSKRMEKLNHETLAPNRPITLADIERVLSKHPKQYSYIFDAPRINMIAEDLIPSVKVSEIHLSAFEKAIKSRSIPFEDVGATLRALIMTWRPYGANSDLIADIVYATSELTHLAKRETSIFWIPQEKQTATHLKTIDTEQLSDCITGRGKRSPAGCVRMSDDSLISIADLIRPSQTAPSVLDKTGGLIYSFPNIDGGSYLAIEIPLQSKVLYMKIQESASAVKKAYGEFESNSHNLYGSSLQLYSISKMGQLLTARHTSGTLGWELYPTTSYVGKSPSSDELLQLYKSENRLHKESFSLFKQEAVPEPKLQLEYRTKSDKEMIGLKVGKGYRKTQNEHVFLKKLSLKGAHIPKSYAIVEDNSGRKFLALFSIGKHKWKLSRMAGFSSEDLYKKELTSNRDFMLDPVRNTILLKGDVENTVFTVPIIYSERNKMYSIDPSSAHISRSGLSGSGIPLSFDDYVKENYSNFYRALHNSEFKSVNDMSKALKKIAMSEKHGFLLDSVGVGVPVNSQPLILPKPPELAIIRSFDDIEADAHVDKAITVGADRNFQSIINGYLTQVVYDVEHNAFIAINSEKAYRVDEITNSLQPLTTIEMNSRYKSELDVVRISSLKSLGFNIDIRTLESKVPNKTSIPKKIHSLWVGPKEISPQNIKNIINNARYAKSKKFEYTLFLSKETKLSLEKNLELLKEIDENIAILEDSLEYTKFMGSKNYAQFLDALGNNESKNTNFASAADILRYHMLYERGGIYIDVDDKLTMRFADKDLAATNNDLLLSVPVSNSDLNMYLKYGNSFIGSHGENIIFKEILEEIFNRYQSNKNFYRSRPAVNDVEKMSVYEREIAKLTGPGVFNDIIFKHLPKAEKVASLVRLLEEGGVEISQKHAFKFSGEFRDMLMTVYEENDVTLLTGMADTGNDHTWKSSRR